MRNKRTPLKSKDDTPGRAIDLVAIGLSALGTVAEIERPFGPENDYKSDAVLFWEPELATFATVTCSVFHRSGRVAALMTSVGSDLNGLLTQQLLCDRGVRLLFARATERTARQLSICPLGTQIRYNLDVPVSRKLLTEAERQTVARTLDEVLSAKWIAFDKYELEIVNQLFSARQWQSSGTRPRVLFETGSRPLAQILAPPREDSQRIAELEYLDHVDLFTTTWEWVVAFATRLGTGAHYLARAPDDWDIDGNSEREFRKLLSKVLPLILPESKSRPLAAIITLGSQGCHVAFRKQDTLPAHRILHRPVRRKAANTFTRLGAGDIFRAALMQALLPDSLGHRVELSSSEWVSPASLLDSIDLAQYAAWRWLERCPRTEDYFGDFPSKFEELRHDWERTEADLEHERLDADLPLSHDLRARFVL